jgi:RimJ/RimL family protein N-acetyltransferase
MEIKLRSTTLGDIDYVFQSENEECNKTFIGTWTKDQHISSLNNPDMRHLIIEHAGSKNKIGYIILGGLTNPNKSIEFIRIVVNDKGKGYGRQAVHLIEKIAFEQLKAHRLWLDVKEFNRTAQNLYESEGFIVEGKLRDYFKTEDCYESLIIMSVLESEYSI